MQLEEFLSRHADLEVVEILLPDINGTLRGKWIAPDKLKKLFEHKLKLPLSSLAFDIWGRDPSEWVFQQGDADGLFDPELGTLSRVPWLSRPTAQIVTSLINSDHSSCAYDPRTIVRQLEEKLGALQLRPVIAVEMEFSLFRQSDSPVPVHTQTTLNGDKPIGGQCYGIDAMQDMAEVLDDIHRACEEQNLPVDTLIKESGISQYEINLYHQTGALIAADQAVLLQRLIRGVAKKHQLHASFMAKPFADDAGNGMHIHCSMVDADGNNVFDNGSDLGSPQLLEAVGGTLDALSDCMLLFAPNYNSYKRLQPGCHAPVTVSWGYDNRTVAVRVPNDDVHAIRLEHRVSGADANPYLAISGLLAGLLHGLKNAMQPPAPIAGDSREQDLASVPTNWRAAIDAFEQSAFVEEYLGSSFQQVFTCSKRQEIKEFDCNISQFEYNTYL